MASYALKAEVRDAFGKEKSKKLRGTGNFPAVVYGAEKDSVALTLNTHETEMVLGRIHGEKVLVDLEYGGTKDKVFVRNVQRDPVKDKLIHVDFYRVDLNREIDTQVAIHAVGTPEGVKLGGFLEHGVREISIRALPTKIPPHISVNVADLKIGQSIHIRDLQAIDGVKIVTPGDALAFAVVVKKKEEEVAPVAAAAAPAAGAAAPAAAGAKGAPAAPAAGAKGAAPAAKAPAKK